MTWDLAGRFWLAERESPRQVVLPATPGAERALLKGFDWRLDGRIEARVGPEAEMAFEWPIRTARVLLLDLVPEPGISEQRAVVVVNGKEAATLDLAHAPGRHAVEIRTELQREGGNRIGLRFTRSTSIRQEATPMEPALERRFAARLHAVTVLEANDPLMRGDGSGPPPIFAAGKASVTQTSPSSLHYALALARQTSLHFAPATHPTADLGEGPRLSVTLQVEGKPERELWARSLRFGQTLPEVVVPLPGPPGEPVRVGLHVEGSGTVTWRSLRLVSPGTPPVARTRTPEDGTGVERLREQAGRANVLLIVLDAARARQLGCYGYPRHTTPEIDRIAAEGVVFERAYVSATYTLASMSSIWTSQPPDVHHRGIRFSAPLPTEWPTLAELLSARGIVTFGAVATAMAGRASGLHRGFGEFREVLGPDEMGSPAASLRQSAEAWLEDHAGERFFAYLHFREPHFPYDPPPPFDTRFGPNAPLTNGQRTQDAWLSRINSGEVRPTAQEVAHLVRLYDGNLASADHEIGRLRAGLERRGLWDKTLVVITGDHGEELAESGRYGHGRWVGEATGHVPLVVRFPGSSARRSVRVGALVDLLDLAPTICDFLRLLPEVAGRFSGTSLLPVISGAPGKPAVLTRSLGDRPRYALFDGRFRLVYDTRSGEEWLFDVDSDPGETRDMAAESPVRAAQMRQTLLDRVAKLLRGAPTATPGAGRLTREQCESLCSLGYIDCDGSGDRE